MTPSATDTYPRRMIYRLVGEGAMVLHMAFLVYVAVGGYLAWYRLPALWPHMACALYGLGITLIGWDCPLTDIETWGRERAGQAGLPPGGFIEHYLTGVVYPREHLLTVQLLVALSVAVSWIGALILHRRRQRHSSENRA
ncbi:hypothetical protein B005_3862 [Nocardiopsis alba ATCC BAA-2165]|jgi:hypothetical protein|uniref:DUF2784 family protein n=2 Tax=Nocardiopsis alba TaxID=53437 RepID=J7KZ21_NOCAA|nr:hypothetical protein B005_3862 [Nocardiopsis alba ATCC BAA-2165]